MPRKPNQTALMNAVCSAVVKEDDSVQGLNYGVGFGSRGGRNTQTGFHFGLSARSERHLTHAIASEFDREGYKAIIEDAAVARWTSGRRPRTSSIPDIRLLWKRDSAGLLCEDSYLMELKMAPPTVYFRRGCINDIEKIDRLLMAGCPSVKGGFAVLVLYKDAYGDWGTSEVDAIAEDLGFDTKSRKGIMVPTSKASKTECHVHAWFKGVSKR